MARVAHLAGANDLVVFAQTPARPRGEASIDPATPADLRSFFADTVRNPCSSDEEPGQRMLVETNVIFRQLTAPPRPPLDEDRAIGFKHPFVKILVSSCNAGMMNRRLIDAGYCMTVPGPVVSLSVLGPASWIDLDQRPETELESAWEVGVYARVCPARCCYPPLPHLTYFRIVDAGAVDTQRTFVVPAGARRLILGTAPTGTTTVVFTVGDPTTALSTTIGTQPMVPSPTFTSPIELSIFGSPSHIQFTPAPTAPGQYYMRWEIGD